MRSALKPEVVFDFAGWSLLEPPEDAFTYIMRNNGCKDFSVDFGWESFSAMFETFSASTAIDAPVSVKLSTTLWREEMLLNLFDSNP